MKPPWLIFEFYRGYHQIFHLTKFKASAQPHLMQFLPWCKSHAGDPGICGLAYFEQHCSMRKIHDTCLHTHFKVFLTQALLAWRGFVPLREVSRQASNLQPCCPLSPLQLFAQCMCTVISMPSYCASSDEGELAILSLNSLWLRIGRHVLCKAGIHIGQVQKGTISLAISCCNEVLPPWSLRSSPNMLVL